MRKLESSRIMMGSSEILVLQKKHKKGRRSCLIYEQGFTFSVSFPHILEEIAENYRGQKDKAMRKMLSVRFKKKGKKGRCTSYFDPTERRLKGLSTFPTHFVFQLIRSA